MIGYLIDGKWIQPGAIEAVEYFKLAGASWTPAASIEEWNQQPESARALSIRTTSGKDILVERPATVSRIDLDVLMREAKKTDATAAAAADTERPELPLMPGKARNPQLVGEGRVTLP
jgi:hypothetical protein